MSKGSLAVVSTIQARFASCKLVALSGNMCTDKKAAATNWLHGRGKSVVIEAVIGRETVESVLKTTVDAIVNVNTQKNLIGSAMVSFLGAKRWLCGDIYIASRSSALYAQTPEPKRGANTEA